MGALSIYRELWKWAEGEGITVHYNGCLPDGEGSFHPDPHDRGSARPTIEIGRPYYSAVAEPSDRRKESAPLPPPDIHNEVLTLAHECGHFLSWRDGTPDSNWDAYHDVAKRRDAAWDAVRREPPDDYDARLRVAAKAALTDADIDLVLAEEERAWALGRQLLERFGFSDDVRFADRKRMGLHYHRYRMGRDELWAEDIADDP